MKTKIIALGIFAGGMTWVMALTATPTETVTGKTPVQTPTGMPASNNYGQNGTTALRTKLKNPDIPSPNDNRINQITPDITNYFNVQATAPGAFDAPGNLSGGDDRASNQNGAMENIFTQSPHRTLSRKKP